MCIFFFTLDHPQYCLIAASNRDEFLARPTRDAAWHSFGSSDPSQSTVLSGIDAHPAGGGTWLGITKSGRFGALLNYTELPPPPPAPELGISKYLSRGEFVRRWLAAHDAKEGPASISGNRDLDSFLQEVNDKKAMFPGFNLLVGEVVPKSASADDEERAFRLGYVSNRTQGEDARPLILETDVEGKALGQCSVCGLSNSVYQDPWSKVKEGRDKLRSTLESWHRQTGLQAPDARDATESEEKELIEGLFTLLGTNSEPDLPEGQPQNIRATIMVPPFVNTFSKQRPGASVSDPTSASKTSKTEPDTAAAAEKTNDEPWYGTRLSTVILIRRRDGAATFVERDVFQLGDDGQVRRAEGKGKAHERKFHFVVD
ncbi:hypothetical protein OC846_002424 [Tilletia horrida]|uniref:Transport and Golgi organization protein 2 n=1 Tax=Tilletia horrida TaxID=155126 RepID=A0AAN6JSZ6_9BASI|nr:hypothetical protein OC845_006651 [Tilletia horrida]KAK0553700.1 hypothetical protein OC846_002424 [Tilletia horrida]KAK0566362.1 hypothetical protein OC861_003293 [Tilletia horrida]